MSEQGPDERVSPNELATDRGEVGEASTEDRKMPRKSFDIDIFRGWCKSCGICVAFCPKHCISLDENGSPVVEDSQQCSGCGWCELHCPDFAISVREAKPMKAVGEED